MHRHDQPITIMTTNITVKYCITLPYHVVPEMTVKISDFRSNQLILFLINSSYYGKS